MAKRQAVLFHFIHIGEWEGMHAGSWRSPNAPASPALDFERIKRMVQTAERGKLHGVFCSDILALPDNYSHEALARTVDAEGYDPFILFSALAACTSQIGLVVTGNTTYYEPYHIARKMASLDHISGGRAAWNVVAGGNHTEARNFSLGETLDHSARYARAQEAYDVVTGLWDSWDDDAFVRDKDSGVYFDIDKLHPLNHKGEFFSVDGPLTIARPPQGYPVIAQAGSSGEGLEFASRVGEIVITHQAVVEQAREFYSELKTMVSDQGRDPDHTLILPGLIFLLGKTQEEADEKLARLDDLADPYVGLKRLAHLIDFDLSDYPLDGPVPEIPVTKVSSKTLQARFVDQAKRDNLTVREFAKLAFGAGTLATTPEGLADRIEEWLTTGAADGHILSVAESTSLELFVDHVVPELQRRGIFQKDYKGNTLRDSLGLPRPANRYLAQTSSGA